MVFILFWGLVLAYLLFMKRKIDFYETAVGNFPAEKFLLSLEDEVQAKVVAAMELIEKEDHVPRELFCKMSGTKDLWEIRIRHNRNIYRFLCFFDGQQLIIVSSGFQKKTQKTPKNEIDTATKRKRDYFKRKGGRS